MISIKRNVLLCVFVFLISNHGCSHYLTHWGRVMHICVGKLIVIGSDNGLSSGCRQAIIWADAGILLIEPFGTNFGDILIKIQTFSFVKMHLKWSSVKLRPFCLSLDVLSFAQYSGGKWGSSYSHVFMWDVITHPSYSFTSSLVQILMNLGHRSVIMYHPFM